MKLYTKPRAVPAELVRETDQVAVNAAGNLVVSVAEYMDLDMLSEETERTELIWAGVLIVHPTLNSDDLYTIVHTQAMQDRIPHRADVIIREVIELDPWSYVRT